MEKVYKLNSCVDVQEGGNHYKNRGIQPIQYAQSNNLDWKQFNVVKYVTRHKDKKGEEDLRKAIHYLQMALEFDYGVRSKVEYDKGSSDLVFPAVSSDMFVVQGNSLKPNMCYVSENKTIGEYGLVKG